MALPLLPGNNFDRNLGKEKFHKSQYCNSKNDVNFIFGDDKSGIGGDPLPGQRFEAPNSLFPSGSGSKIPTWLSFDKQVLSFDAYYQEAVFESNIEQYRIRPCKLYFYLEDDTIQLIEPRLKNSGLPQGTVLRRHRIAKPAPNDALFFTVHDLNVGAQLSIYGKAIKLVSCDEFTHNFLRKLGVQVGKPESIPSDTFNVDRKLKEESMQPLRPYERQDTLKQFLDHDRHVLRFFCYWDDTDNLYGDLREMVLHYYLADDTIEVREVINANSGRDAVPCFLKRSKLLKEFKEIPLPGVMTDRTLLNVLGNPQKKGRFLIDSLKTGAVNFEYYKDSDLSIGVSMNVNGRKFIIYDMDEFTKEYYRSKYNLTDFTPIKPNKARGEPISREYPPYNGWGSEEDSLGNCRGLLPKPPQRDFMKFMQKDRQGLESHVLRYSAHLITDKQLDQGRRFIISYFLSDDSILIFETEQKNSGFMGGKFLERNKIKRPGQEKYSTRLPEYYQAADMYIGNVLEINKFRFKLDGADEYAFAYMEANPSEFAFGNLTRILSKLKLKFGGNESHLMNVLSSVETATPGTISTQRFRESLRSMLSNEDLNDHEILTLARYFSNRNVDEINPDHIFGAVQQELRKYNFDNFQKLKEALFNSSKSADKDTLSAEEVRKIFKVFKLPIVVDVLNILLEILTDKQTGNIPCSRLLEKINWRENPIMAPESLNANTSKCSVDEFGNKTVESVNFTQLLNQLNT